MGSRYSKCSGPECERAAEKRGLCGTHYSQWYRNNPGQTVRNNKPPPGADEVRPWLARWVAYGRPASLKGLTPLRAREARRQTEARIRVRLPLPVKEALEAEGLRRGGVKVADLVSEIVTDYVARRCK